MTPYVAATLQQVLTDALSAGSGPVDGLLRRYFRGHPALGRRDRGDIAETVFDVLRNRRLYASLAQSGQGRAERRLVLASASPRRLMLLSWGRRGLLAGGAGAGVAAAGTAGSGTAGAGAAGAGAAGAGAAGSRVAGSLERSRETGPPRAAERNGADRGSPRGADRERQPKQGRRRRDDAGGPHVA
ncbi:MAG TPA: hypothetical protein PKA20_26600, partial [Burkholderiaceae bacterium]|nr:hypothetical protein [Burkholderiaceae bacterium]